MLKSEKKRSAIQELIEDRTIENFSKENMEKLVEKGNSTHEEDMQKLLSLMKDFLSAIMSSGNNKIEKVEKIVDDKVKGMKPPAPQLDSPNSEQVSEKGITRMS